MPKYLNTSVEEAVLWDCLRKAESVEEAIEMIRLHQRPEGIKITNGPTVTFNEDGSRRVIFAYVYNDYEYKFDVRIAADDIGDAPYICALKEYERLWNSLLGVGDTEHVRIVREAGMDVLGEGMGIAEQCHCVSFCQMLTLTKPDKYPGLQREIFRRLAGGRRYRRKIR
jgi:hypothetical protein